MSHNDYSDENAYSSQEYVDKDLDIEKLVGSIMMTNEDDLLTQIMKWYLKTSYITFLE